MSIHSYHCTLLKMNAPKRTRVRLSLAKRIELLDLIKEGKPRPEICRLHGVAPTTLHHIIKEETKLRAEFEKNGNAKRLTLRQAPHHQLEQSLIKWVCIVRDRKIAISGPMVQEKALEFARILNVKDFVASSGWLARFKKRENLDFKNVVSEGGDVNLDVVQNWTDNVLPSLLKDYSESDIYNADETGLFYHCQPNKLLHFRGERWKGGKQSKEWISVLVSTNMSGMDKTKLLAIRKLANPI